MDRLIALHPNTVMAISTGATFAIGIATHNFWAVLIVGVAFIAPLRRSARRHSR